MHMSNSKKNLKNATSVAGRTSAVTAPPAPASKAVSPSAAKGLVQTPVAGPVRTTTMETKPGAREVSTQAVAEAAYFLWLQRGGNQVVNWLEAEAALRTGITKG
jgi:hypothetical protein